MTLSPTPPASSPWLTFLLLLTALTWPLALAAVEQARVYGAWIMTVVYAVGCELVDWLNRRR